MIAKGKPRQEVQVNGPARVFAGSCGTPRLHGVIAGAIGLTGRWLRLDTRR